MTRYISIERVVTLLAPFFAAVASWVCTLVANNVPGAPKLDPTAIAILMAAAFVATILLVIKWLHGRQIPAIAGLHITSEQVAQLQSEAKDYLAAHAGEIRPAEAEVAKAVEAYLATHAPQAAVPDLDAIVEAVLGKLTARLASSPPGVVTAPGAAATTPA